MRRTLSMAALLGLALAATCGAEAWLSEWPAPDADFIVRFELKLDELGGEPFWLQALLVLGLFPLGGLAAGLLGSGLGSLLSPRAGETARAVLLAVAGLGLVALVPVVMAWTALVALQDDSVNLDLVVGGGLASLVLVAAAPLGAMARAKRLHGKTGLLELLIPVVVPGIAAAQYMRGLDRPDAAGLEPIRRLYDGLVMAAAFDPARLALVAAGGLVLFAGVVLAPLTLQGVFEVLGALREKLFGR